MTTTNSSTLDAAPLRQLIAAERAPRLLGVRTAGEFASAHIPGSYKCRWTCSGNTARGCAATSTRRSC